MNGRINERVHFPYRLGSHFRSWLDCRRSAVMILLKSVLPILLLTGVFVGAVYFVKYIIHRFMSHK